jgi:hypothetical protein
MLIWSGWGLAALLPVPLIPLLGIPLTNVLGVADSVGLGLGMLLAGGIGTLWTRWFESWRERRVPARRLVDARTGQQFTVSRRDSLFWIPMRYLWVPYVILAAGGVAVTVTSLLG